MKEWYRIVVENDWHWMASAFSLEGAIEAAKSLAAAFLTRAWIFKTNRPGGATIAAFDWAGRNVA